MGIKRFSNTSASYLSYQIAWECDDMNMQAPSITETKKKCNILVEKTLGRKRTRREHNTEMNHTGKGTK
jgi:hypothetical protein